MLKFIVITALGEDKPGIVKTLSKAIHDLECNIVDSRMSVLGGHFAVISLVSGQWNKLAKLENQLPELSKQLDMTIVSKHTARRSHSSPLVPYQVEVVSIDHPGIVHNLTSFFYNRDINVENMNTSTYSAAHTGTQMFAVDMTINITPTQSIAQLKEDFLDFCDELNLDAHIEPCKG